MKRIIVTPAGRKRYLEVLLNNLKKNREEFDRWDLWVNTENLEDIEYMKELSRINNFIKLIYLKVPYNKNFSIGSFFTDYVNSDEIYLRLDDDIVFIGKGSIKKIFDEREKNTENFLLYGNIINNAIMSHFHQGKGVIPQSEPLISYKCLDSVGWENPAYAELIHRSFLEKLNSSLEEEFKIHDWILDQYERVSINAIAWRGDEFLKFQGIIAGEDEEVWLSEIKPAEISKPNKVIGDTLFVHYSFFTQRSHMDSTDILPKYKEISER